jgi:hypothetical protein
VTLETAIFSLPSYYRPLQYKRVACRVGAFDGLLVSVAPRLPHLADENSRNFLLKPWLTLRFGYIFGSIRICGKCASLFTILHKKTGGFVPGRAFGKVRVR